MVNAYARLLGNIFFIPIEKRTEGIITNEQGKITSPIYLRTERFISLFTMVRRATKANTATLK